MVAESQLFRQQLAGAGLLKGLPARNEVRLRAAECIQVPAPRRKSTLPPILVTGEPANGLSQNTKARAGFLRTG